SRYFCWSSIRGFLVGWCRAERGPPSPLVGLAPLGTTLQITTEATQIGGRSGGAYLRQLLLVGIAGDDLGETPDDFLGLDALGLGVEVRDDAVPQHGDGDGADVLARDVIATVQHG